MLHSLCVWCRFDFFSASILSLKLLRDWGDRNSQFSPEVGSHAIIFELTLDFNGFGSGLAFCSQIEATYKSGTDTFFAGRFQSKIVSGFVVTFLASISHVVIPCFFLFLTLSRTLGLVSRKSSFQTIRGV